MTRLLRRLGLALSLAAYALLAFHVDHAEADHADPAHHCCPCHTYTATPNPSATVSPTAAVFERRIVAHEPEPALASRRSPSSPRAPPAA